MPRTGDRRLHDRRTSCLVERHLHGYPTLNNFYGNGLVDAEAAVALSETHE